LGVGNVLSESLRGMTGEGGAAAGAPPGGAPGGGMPDVMTPAEAATVMRVSEEDVVAAIEAGDLKARRIGNAYRISRAALDDFLKG
jgi:excisionase family DNA binding protein